MKTVLAAVLCLFSSTALAESEALVWDHMDTAGYDSYFAAKCYVYNGANNTFCTYTDAGYTSCQVMVWGYWVHYQFRGNFTRNGNYSGTLTTDTGALVTHVQYGNRVQEPHGDYVVLQRFFNGLNGAFQPYCEIRRKLGITFAVRL